MKMHTQIDIHTSRKSQACNYVFSDYGANLSTSPGQAERTQSAGSESRKANEKRQENRMLKPTTKVDEAGRLCLVQWHLYAIGIAHKGSFHRLTMANLLRSAQQTRNSHQKQDTRKAKFKWQKNCHCTARKKQEALTQGYIMLGCMTWRVALVIPATLPIKCSVAQQLKA